jgi:hypothetical protein
MPQKFSFISKYKKRGNIYQENTLSLYFVLLGLEKSSINFGCMNMARYSVPASPPCEAQKSLLEMSKEILSTNGGWGHKPSACKLSHIVTMLPSLFPEARPDVLYPYSTL